MSKEHKHHHNESDHGSHCKKGTGCSPWKTMVTKGIWVIYPIMGICFLHMLWLLNDRIDSIMYNTVPIHEKPMPFVDIKMPVAGSVMSGMDLKLIKQPSAEMLKLGKATYQINCISCHGPTGMGDGPAGLAIHARNFTLKDGWKNGRELGNMFTSITKGVGVMSAFDTLPVETRISLIHYVRTFGEFPEISDAEVNELDKQFSLSKETVTPHKIPITLATQILLDEVKAKNQKNHEIAQSIIADSSAGAILLKEQTDNLEKFVNALQSNAHWKKDIESFSAFLSVNVGVIGIRPNILLLEKSKLEELYNYLKEIK